MRVKVTTICLTLTFVGILFMMHPVRQVSAQQVCDGKISLIYARGSGQKINANVGEDGYEKERDTLKSKLDSFLGEKYEFIELGHEDVLNGNTTYPAVKVWGTDGYLNGAIATISNGDLGRYQKSVETGKEQLIDLLLKKGDTQCFVLSGYSQGAHVIGEALADSKLSSIKNKIIYVGLLGDPKLDTQGYGTFFEYGKYTPWYRGDVVPFLQSGLLGPRRPDYIPRIALEEKKAFTTVGSWCYNDDLICTNNIAGGLIDNGHSKYSERAIPQMVQEIVNEIAIRTATPSVAPTCGASKQDIVLAVNMSAAVRSDTVFLSDDGIKKTVDGAFKSGCDVRVGLSTFGVEGVDPTQPVIDFTEDKAVLTDALKSFRTGFTPTLNIEKVDVADGIKAALDFVWRDEAQKAIIVMSDATGNDYVTDKWGEMVVDKLIRSPVTQEIIRKSREKGGIEIHAAEIAHTSGQGFNYLSGPNSFYEYVDHLVKATAGTFTHINRCNHCSWRDVNFDFQSTLSRKPIVSVPTIRIKQGENVTLSAKDISGGVIDRELLAPNAVIGYSWNLDCEQLITPTLFGQTVTYTAQKTGDCMGAVLVKANSSIWCNICYDSNAAGARAVTPFRIEVLPADYVAPPAPGVIQNVIKERLWDNDTIRISWDPPANSTEVGELAYIIRDSDGSVLGATRSTKLHITDVADTDNPIVLISAASANGTSTSYDSENAEDISLPAPQTTVRAIEQTYGVLASEAVAAPGNTRGVIDIEASPIIPKVLGEQVARPIFDPDRNDGIDADHETSNIWVQFTVIAMPIAAAIALGFVVKYGMILRAK